MNTSPFLLQLTPYLGTCQPHLWRLRAPVDKDSCTLIRWNRFTSYLDLSYKLVNGHREDLTTFRWNDDLDARPV